MKYKQLSVLLLLIFVLAGCGAKPPQQKSVRTVIVTTFPAYDWAREILGDSDAIDLRLLSENGVDLHSYQATADDLVMISGCDLFVYVGGESDEWVEDVLQAVPNPNRRELSLLSLLEGRLHEEETVEGMQVRGIEEEEEEAYDEHVWLSVKNARILSEGICQAMCSLDEGGRDSYRENLQRYDAALAQLDQAFTQTVADGSRNTLLFCDRFPFRYLVEDYHLNYYAAFSGCSGDSEASFATVLFLAEKLDELELPAVFQLEDSDGQLAETVVGCTLAKNQSILTLNSMQSVSLAQSREGATYLNLMQQNLSALAQALQ